MHLMNANHQHYFWKLGKLLIFVAWSGGKTDKPNPPLCLQNNQYHGRKWKALKPHFLNGYSQETREWFLSQKSYLGDLNLLYIAMTNGSERRISGVSENDEDYKVSTEADKNKNVSLENVSRNTAICEESRPAGLGQSVSFSSYVLLNFRQCSHFLWNQVVKKYLNPTIRHFVHLVRTLCESHWYLSVTKTHPHFSVFIFTDLSFILDFTTSQ